MDDLDPRISSFADVVSDGQATGRDSNERSETEQKLVGPGSNEVVPKWSRRKFSAAAKIRILDKAGQCTKPGEIGALLRREGIYSSNLAKWRQQRAQGELVALSEKKRGRKSAAQNPLSAKLAESEKLVKKLEKRLEHAEAIIGFQKKFLEIVGKLPNPESGEVKS